MLGLTGTWSVRKILAHSIGLTHNFFGEFLGIAIFRGITGELRLHSMVAHYDVRVSQALPFDL